MKNKLYKLAAIAAGIGWGISIYVTLVDGESVFEFLRYVSQTDFQYHPMLDYWGKLTGVAFSFIGVGFLFVALRGEKYPMLRIYFAWFQIICFLVVFITVFRLDLNTNIYYLDFLFFLGTGIPMLLTAREK